MVLMTMKKLCCQSSASNQVTRSRQTALVTVELTVFPKTREISTEKQVTVQSPQADFISQGLKSQFK